MSEAGSVQESNKAIATKFWEALGERDFDAVGAFMAPDGHYIDVPVIGGEDGAHGPEEVAARLRLGIEPLEKYDLRDGQMTAEGNRVITEHSEEWTWHTGESVLLRFCSVQEFEDGLVTRWWDYVDLSLLLNAAPDWWTEHIMKGYK